MLRHHQRLRLLLLMLTKQGLPAKHIALPIENSFGLIQVESKMEDLKA